MSQLTQAAPLRWAVSSATALLHGIQISNCDTRAVSIDDHLLLDELVVVLVLGVWPNCAF